MALRRRGDRNELRSIGILAIYFPEHCDDLLEYSGSDLTCRGA